MTFLLSGTTTRPKIVYRAESPSTPPAPSYKEDASFKVIGVDGWSWPHCQIELTKRSADGQMATHTLNGVELKQRIKGLREAGEPCDVSVIALKTVLAKRGFERLQHNRRNSKARAEARAYAFD